MLPGNAMHLPYYPIQEKKEPMLRIDIEKCIGCGKCVSVCVRDNITIKEGKALEKCNDCFACGHCIAICPKGAVSLIEFSDFFPKEYDGSDVTVSLECMRRFMENRRSIRLFRSDKIPRDELEKLFEAVRYSPTAQNSQSTEFAVLDEDLDEFMKIVEEVLEPLADKYPRIAQLNMYRKRRSEFSMHPLLWEGKQMICAFSEKPADSIIALSRIEMMAYSMGLGGFYSLFIAEAAELDPEKIMSFFAGIPKNKILRGAFIIGYPRLKFKRTVPRKEVRVEWR